MKVSVGCLAVGVLALVACGPNELSTPSLLQVERIILDTFEGSEVSVREVVRTQESLRAAAELNGSDVTVVLGTRDRSWQVARIEQGGNAYTVGQLQEISATMVIMGELSDALENYREANGEFPLLDDQVGLLELVPDYFEHTPGMPLLDVWQSPFRYRFQGEDYTITSEGPDRSIGTPDDVILITGSFVAAQ